MQTDSVEKAAGVGAIGLWAAMHGWLGWLVVLYAACMMLDCLTGTAQAIKNGEWSSHKARQGLWHKGGSIIMVFVSVLTDMISMSDNNGIRFRCGFTNGVFDFAVYDGSGRAIYLSDDKMQIRGDISADTLNGVSITSDANNNLYINGKKILTE